MRYRFLRYPDGKAKAVTLSYDDGRVEDMRLSDVITKAGLKCTFNLCGQANIKGMSVQQIKEYILDRGHEIAVHGAFHRAVGTQRPVNGIKDCLDCRLELEKTYGIIIRGMAYPDTGIRLIQNNTSYEKIRRYLADLDIVYARTTLGDDDHKFELPQDWYAWMPSAHHINPRVLSLIDEFLNLDLSPETYHAMRHPRLFYLWGHAYEFKRDNNWHLLDEICEKLAGRDDIWYATNMEIYEYVNAYNSLWYSADETIMYNPTLTDVWFDIDGKTMCIKSGETLKLE